MSSDEETEIGNPGTTGAKALLAAEQLYRCERVFILQPQRVILDEQFRTLLSKSRQLVSLLSEGGERSERTCIDDLHDELLRLVREFTIDIEEAGKIHDYTN
jgi:hypothetical protein